MSPLAQRVVSQEEDDIEIWHYMELGEQEATRSLFVKSILRATTSRRIPRNLLYPGFFDKAVRLRLDPPHVKVALISEVPLTTMFATILEHKSVSRLDIIRTDENIQDLIVKGSAIVAHQENLALAIAWRTNELPLSIYTGTGIDEWMDSKGDRGQATTLYDLIFADDKSFGMEELSLGSKLVGGGLVVTGNGEETGYQYQSSSNTNVESIGRNFYT